MGSPIRHADLALIQSGQIPFRVSDINQLSRRSVATDFVVLLLCFKRQVLASAVNLKNAVQLL